MRTVIVGFDSFDPGTFERLYESGKLPNLGKYAGMGGYSRAGGLLAAADRGLVDMHRHGRRPRLARHLRLRPPRPGHLPPLRLAAAHQAERGG